MYQSPSDAAAELERRSRVPSETRDECRGSASESWVIEAAVLGLAIAAGIGAGVWLGSMWLGAAAGVVVFSGFGGAQVSLARRLGWQRFSLFRALRIVWEFLCSIDFVVTLLRLLFR